MKQVFFILGTSIFLLGCGTTQYRNVLTYSAPLENNAPVEIIAQGQNVPINAKLLGSVNIGDTGFTTKCSYQQVVSDMLKQARAMGGNLVYITKHQPPDEKSTCHRISVNVYKVE